MNNIKIVTFAPIASADAVRQAIGDAGAGVIGEYSFCSFSVTGQGRFIPSGSAKPYIGQPGQPETVSEERIEVVCQRQNAKAVIAAMRAAHPYQEVAFDIYELLDEGEL
jgi:hypothetical protein